MTTPVVLTKVTLPHRRKEILTRPRLISLLDELTDNKLVLVTAPAGYGKTSLLIDFAHRIELPVCWFSIDTADQDLQRFLAHFIAAIEARFSKFGQQSRTLLQSLSSGGVNIESAVTAIVNEIYLSIQEHFIIVLDDFQFVNDNAEIIAFVNRFIQDVDQNCHLVILSRTFISLPDLPLFVARSQAGGIGLQDLAFQADEIRALMLQNYQQVIPEAIAEELVLKTEGWITGLLLTAHSMWEGMVNRLRHMRLSGVGLYDYLAHQVLDQQRPELRDFLLRTSVFEEFNADLCQTLLGEPPPGRKWQDILDEVLKNNLFVLPIGEAQPWLRYHHLFRDFLQNLLAQEKPEEKERLLRTLIQIYTSREEWERAYTTCLHLGDLETTVNFLERAGEPMIRNGRITLLGKWLENLPAEVIANKPTLLARQGMVLATEGNTDRGLQLLDRAVSLFQATQDKKRLAGALVWRALVHYIQSNYNTSITDANAVISLTEPERDDQELSRFRAEAYRILGQNARILGKLDEAIRKLSQGLNIYQSLEDDQGINLIRLNLGPAYTDAGDLREAISSYARVREYYQKRRDLFNLSSVLNDLACIYHMRGEFPQALATFEEALENAKQSGNLRAQAFVWTGLGDLFLDLDTPEAASEAYQQAHTLGKRLKDHFLTLYINLADAAVARLKGELRHAKALLEAMEIQVLQSQSRYTQGLFSLEAGKLAIVEGRFQEAQVTLTKAAQIFLNGGQKIWAGRTCLLLAYCHYQLSESQKAQKLLQQAFDLVSYLDSWFVLVPLARQAKPLLKGCTSAPAISIEVAKLIKQVETFESALPHLKRSLRFQQIAIALPPPHIRIQALGAAQVSIGGKPVTSADWQTQSTRDLLFLILSEPRGWTKEALGEILWPESTPIQLKNRFKNALYRLRRALQQDVIIFDGNRYVFNKNLDYEYDVERFLELALHVKEMSDLDEGKKAYQEMMQIYQGEYLPEVQGSWVLPEREHLRTTFLNAGLQLAKLYLEASQPDLAWEICKRLIAEDSCFEKAYCLAMQAQATLGNKPAIIQLHESLEERLSREWGISPSAQTEALFRSLVK